MGIRDRSGDETSRAGARGVGLTRQNCAEPVLGAPNFENVPRQFCAGGLGLLRSSRHPIRAWSLALGISLEL